MNDTDQLHILEKIKAERAHQDEKWGETDHHPLMWFSIIGEEYGKMLRAFNEYSRVTPPELSRTLSAESSDLLEKMQYHAVTTAASCVAMLECLERISRRGLTP